MKYLALLRGINVSGKRIIKMNQLSLLFESLAYRNVKTYIQSGNVVFETDIEDNLLIKNTIESAINTRFGFDVKVFILSKIDWEEVILNNPFINDQNINIDKLHLSFLSSIPDNKLIDLMSVVKSPDERFHLDKNVIYLYCPDGYGQTKLTNTFIESKLKLNATTRNWRTILKIQEMINF